MNNFHILIICFIKKFCKFVCVAFFFKNVHYLFNVMNEALAAWNWKLKSLSTGACPWKMYPIIMRIFYCKVFGCLLSLELNILNRRTIFSYFLFILLLNSIQNFWFALSLISKQTEGYLKSYKVLVLYLFRDIKILKYI
jgi:hypothetical protein